MNKDYEITFAQGHRISEVPGRHWGGFIIKWSASNVGFGEFTFIWQLDGTIKVDNETMCPEFVFDVLRKYFADGEQIYDFEAEERAIEKQLEENARRKDERID